MFSILCFSLGVIHRLPAFSISIHPVSAFMATESGHCTNLWTVSLHATQLFNTWAVFLEWPETLCPSPIGNFQQACHWSSPFKLQTEETALPSVSSWNQSKTKANQVIACILSNSHDFLWPWLTCIMLHHGGEKGKGGSQADRGRLLLICFFPCKVSHC